MITSHELRILSKGKMKGKLKIEAPKQGHPKITNKPVVLLTPKLKSNPGIGLN